MNLFNSISRYAPLRWDTDQPETREEYVERMRLGILSNVPECVLANWLYRHWIALHKWGCYVDIKALRFTKKEYNLADVPGLDAMCEGADEHYYHVLLDAIAGGDYSRDHFVYGYIREHGAWPCPPVLLDTSLSQDTYWKTFKRPIEVLEGHHRLAYLLALKEMGVPLQPTHTFWVATPTTE